MVTFQSNSSVSTGGIATDRHNRYLIPKYPFDGPMPADAEPVKGVGMAKPYTRVSTLVDTHQDKEGIFIWGKRLITKGIGARSDLYALAAATRLEDKGTLDSIWKQAFDYAKGQAASNLGTALHSFLERVLAGEDLEVPAPWDKDVAATLAEFQDHGIRLRPELQELVIVRPDLRDGDAAGVAGRFDLLVEETVAGQVGLTVADYKTGSDPLAYGSWEIQQKMGLYGSGWAVWDGEFWRPMPAGIRKDRVLMVHVLPGQAKTKIHVGRVDPAVLEDDLAAAYRTRARRKEAKSAWAPLGAEPAAPVDVPGHSTGEELATKEASYATPQMEADRAKAEERLEQITTGLAKDVGPAIDRAILNGEGKELQPLAVAGKRGCSVCGRVGHRKGSKACLGDKDPAAGVVAEVGAANAFMAEPAAHVHRDWTRNPLTGSWECGVEECGHPAAEPVQAELTAAQAAQSEPAAVLPDEPDPFADPVPAQPVTPEDVDPFAEPPADPRDEFLALIKAAPDKAALRAIRDEATKAGLWDQKLSAAGLARVKEL